MRYYPNIYMNQETVRLFGIHEKGLIQLSTEQEIVERFEPGRKTNLYRDYYIKP